MTRLALLRFASLAFLLACRKDAAVTVITPVASASVSATPVDHLATNELLEGDAKAFGITLPRGVHVDNAFADAVFASGQVPTAAVANYIRTHVREGKMIQPDFTTDRTTFDHVRVPAMPDKQLVVYVEPARGAVATTRIEVHDVTPAKAAVLPNEAARWAAAGLKPNGQVLDTAHLQ
jgi:hypothetical protein